MNPSFGALLDSTGAAAGIGLAPTGATKAFRGFNNPGSDARRRAIGRRGTP